ncbi:MarR family winged helix-turn-helix transcriptional regulator [Flavisolibacter nicotianae]|uniref:MarR family winged helix-turn-helix transcriptional regulator n=1 Tax=Flavisolibacter nicotianae TaxID=2364882 RepID=UPI000EAFF52D|nr:MarR family transcriptional regulator [Flavisolibacter nicotianae]
MAMTKNDTLSAFTMSMRKAMLEFKSFLRNKLKESNIDLTFEMLQVLIELWKKDGVNQQELANLLHKDKASLTYLIDNLSKRKLVQRFEDPNDRRNKIITLLPEGSRLQAVILPWIDEMYTVAGKDIPVQLIKDGILLFEKIQSNLNPSAHS